MSNSPHIRYRFDLPDGSHEVFDFWFREPDFRLVNPPPAETPFWAELTFNQCANCPLNAAEQARCPPAAQMVGALDKLNTLVSFDTVGVTVVQAERTVYAQVSAQDALSSVLGLIMATAGCPWTDLLRPMARFHLPFANEAETIYRTVTMFLLARELGCSNDAGGFDTLEALYGNLHIVNRDMSRRLGAATRTDPARNAIAMLDAYTLLLPAAIAGSLEELKPLFAAWATVGQQLI